MFQPMNIIKISMVIAIGILLQILLIIADDTNGPSQVALKFTKAYYASDRTALSELTCNEIAEQTDAIDQYITRIEKEAKDTGFKLYSKSMIYHVKEHVVRMDTSKAQVIISGKKRHSINPVFTMVAIIFQMGEVDHFDKTIDLINENGQWKVCGKAFS